MFGTTWEICLEFIAPDPFFKIWCASVPDNLIGKVKCLIAREVTTLVWSEYHGDINWMLDVIARSTSKDIRIDVWYMGVDGPYAGYQSAANGQYLVGETAINGPITSPFYDECHFHICQTCMVDHGIVTAEELKVGLAAYEKAIAQLKPPNPDGFSDSFPL